MMEVYLPYAWCDQCEEKALKEAKLWQEAGSTITHICTHAALCYEVKKARERYEQEGAKQ